MIAVGIVRHSTHSDVVDNNPHIGVDACQHDAGRGIECDIVLVAALNAVDLNVGIIKLDGTGAAAVLAGVVVAERDSAWGANRGAETDLAMIE